MAQRKPKYRDEEEDEQKIEGLLALLISTEQLCAVFSDYLDAKSLVRLTQCGWFASHCFSRTETFIWHRYLSDPLYACNPMIRKVCETAMTPKGQTPAPSSKQGDGDGDTSKNPVQTHQKKTESAYVGDRVHPENFRLMVAALCGDNWLKSVLKVKSQLDKNKLKEPLQLNAPARRAHKIAQQQQQQQHNQQQTQKRNQAQSQTRIQTAPKQKVKKGVYTGLDVRPASGALIDAAFESLRRGEKRQKILREGVDGP
uniref:Uncharacterized protein n=1 Tax=Chromera velia CCMP2878 TaxID=1169474 RepID=A0A0G4F3B3_9ALVE|eukprot:Cvel_14966.t1-p1 / transcript=Cvel_14966.t1 / gene=Cvel_14966 / organism=Chromera_velia_CCMP2878 / gene_product=hypothetical protein / transcript_product=hypothetical protein / location=Cvel_scaffold1087:3197-3961(-) / protein_length=255 / sequence_SO=supercontig / SO=protein_coding / is_pseudo=false